LLDQLTALSGDLRERQQMVRRQEDRRNALIKQALEDGWTHQQISDATGLSRGRISQIAV
jgi:DNA-directed RNA polymerase specialized sigma24 family protein